MANFTTKTIKEVFDSFIAKYTVIRSKYGDETPLLEKSLIKSIGYAIAGEAGTIWQLSVWIYKQCFPQTAELPALKLWGNLVGVEYKYGTSANLTIKLDDVTAESLSSGTVYKDLITGLIFKTISQAVNEDGTITATVACSTQGSIGNLPVGTILNIANPLNGIPSTATIIGSKIEGVEDEDVEAYRKRVLYRFRNKSQSGSPLDYYTWIMEVPGIVDALPYVLEEGKVTIYTVSEGSGKDRTPTGFVNPNPYPVWENGQFTELTGDGQFLQMANAIEGSEEGVHDRRPVMAEVELLPPNYTPFTVEIDGLTDTTLNEQLKNVLINIFDSKRPHLVVLDYPLGKAKINQLQLSAACTAILDGESFTSFILKDENETSISETTLGIGCLPYLKKFIVNNKVVYSADDEEEAENEENA